MGVPIEFSVVNYGKESKPAIDFVHYKPISRKHFPSPHKDFDLIIDGKTYCTSIQNVKNGQIIIAKTFDANKCRVTRPHLCNKHDIRLGDHLLIEVLVPLKTYLLINLSRLCRKASFGAKVQLA